MEIFGIVATAYLIIGAVLTSALWVTLRYQVYRGHISRNDETLKSVGATMPMLVLLWPFAIRWTYKNLRA